jgi:hypothetical protein
MVRLCFGKNHGTCVLSLMVAQRKLTSYVTDGWCKVVVLLRPLKAPTEYTELQWREVEGSRTEK